MVAVGDAHINGALSGRGQAVGFNIIERGAAHSEHVEIVDIICRVSKLEGVTIAGVFWGGNTFTLPGISIQGDGIARRDIKGPFVLQIAIAVLRFATRYNFSECLHVATFDLGRGVVTAHGSSDKNLSTGERIDDRHWW